MSGLQEGITLQELVNLVDNKLYKSVKLNSYHVLRNSCHLFVRHVTTCGPRHMTYLKCITNLE